MVGIRFAIEGSPELTAAEANDIAVLLISAGEGHSAVLGQKIRRAARRARSMSESTLEGRSESPTEARRNVVLDRRELEQLAGLFHDTPELLRHPAFERLHAAVIDTLEAIA